MISMQLEKLQSLNPQLKIKPVTEPSFKRYGKLYESIDLFEAAQFINGLQMPDAENDIYVKASSSLKDMKIFNHVRFNIFGGVEIDMGYAIGHSKGPFDLCEYHRCNELLAVIDQPLVMFFGDQRDIEDNKYDLSLMEAFYVPAGTAVDLYSTTLHGFPYQTSDEGYRMIVTLPHKTNDQKDFETDPSYKQTALLYSMNAFLIGKKNCTRVKDIYPGLTGHISKIFY